MYCHIAQVVEPFGTGGRMIDWRWSASCSGYRARGAVEPRQSSRKDFLGDTERRRVGHPGRQDLRVGTFRTEFVDEAGCATDDEVVVEVHQEAVVAREFARDEHCVGRPGGWSWGMYVTLIPSFEPRQIIAGAFGSVGA